MNEDIKTFDGGFIFRNISRVFTNDHIPTGYSIRDIYVDVDAGGFITTFNLSFTINGTTYFDLESFVNALYQM